MTTEYKKEVINLLQEHVSKIEALQFGNYAQAESLSMNTKILYSRYFQRNEFDLFDFVTINFRTSWDEAYGRMLIVSHAMLYEMKLPSGKALNPEEESNDLEIKTWNFRKASGFSICFIIPSFFLWIFNTWVKWQWLATHPKKIAIYLSFQVGIIIVSALIFTNNKQVRVFEWFICQGG